MDFPMISSSNQEQQQPQEILLERSSSKSAWILNMDNDDYFNWTNSFDDDGAELKNAKKRKLDAIGGDNNNGSSNNKKSFKFNNKTAQSNNHSNNNGGLGDTNNNQKDADKKIDVNETSRFQQWQVADIPELNGDIDGLGADLNDTSYNISLPGLAAFKQEAPSPTNDANFQQIARQTNGQNHQTVAAVQQNNVNNISDSALHQLLEQNGYNSFIEGQDTFSGGSSPQQQYSEDCRFQYVLAAATSTATKINEDTLTYLNQGQSYEIKLKKLGDLSTYRGKMLKSTIRICFHERRLQYMEKEQMQSWQKARPGDRILEIDVPLSYGLLDIVQPSNALNVVQFNWDPTKEVGVYIKVNCISTEFTPKKHGGEKGVPFRIQVETYQASDAYEASKRLHAAACQIKVFKLKGADRKHKQDREKISKRSATEQEKYQPSYECTVLNDIPIEAVVSSPSPVPYSPDSGGFANPSPPSTTTTTAAAITSAQQPISIPTKVVAEEVTSLSSPVRYGNNAVVNVETKSENENLSCTSDILTTSANPQQTATWLIANRFNVFQQTFANFAGSDMLRMSREDLIQICGQADGIRLYNALHAKVIIPKLTIYVSRDSETYHAIYLISLTNHEIAQKLSHLFDIPTERIKEIFIEGPQSIRVHLTNDVIRHMRPDTLFKLDVMQEANNGKYQFLLRNTMKMRKDVNKVIDNN